MIERNSEIGSFHSVNPRDIAQAVSRRRRECLSAVTGASAATALFGSAPTLGSLLGFSPEMAIGKLLSEIL